MPNNVDKKLALVLVLFFLLGAVLKTILPPWTWYALIGAGLLTMGYKLMCG